METRKIGRWVGAARQVSACVSTDESGSAFVELAIILPALLFMLAGAFTIGQLITQWQQISGVVDAGVLYTARYGWCTQLPCTSGTTSVTGITNALNGTGIMTPQVTTPACFYGCPTATGVARYKQSGSDLACTGTPTGFCAGSVSPGQYVWLSASKTWSPIFDPFGFSKSVATTTSNAVVRVQ